MLNRIILMGRLTHTPEIKLTPNGVSVLSFSLAVERSYRKQGEDKQTDFIDCVAWRQTAEFINKYFRKGALIAIEGNLQTRSYEDKNGNKHKAVEVVVDNVSFTGERSQDVPEAKPELSKDPLPPELAADFEEIISDDGVPF